MRRGGSAPCPAATRTTMTVDYPTLARTIAALTEGEDDTVALMATLACEIHHSDDRFDWTGFYRVTAPGLLKIGPYQGGHGCLVIPFSRGVCGACARSGERKEGRGASGRLPEFLWRRRPSFHRVREVMTALLISIGGGQWSVAGMSPVGPKWVRPADRVREPGE